MSAKPVPLKDARDHKADHDPWEFGASDALTQRRRRLVLGTPTEKRSVHSLLAEPYGMRWLLMVVLTLPLVACGVSWTVPVGAAAGVNIVSIIVLHRSLFDVLWSLATGRDCSIVRLDQGLSYCKRLEPEPPPLEYCTRTLGWADCWTDPELFVDPPRQLADGPYELTPAQEKNRTQSWP